MEHSIGRVLRDAALRWPTKPAILDLGASDSAPRELSFAQLHTHASAIADTLREQGLIAGDCIALTAENSAAFVATWFGITYAGCTIVPLPIHSSPADLRFRVTHAACKAILFDPPRTSLVDQALENLDPPPLRLAVNHHSCSISSESERARREKPQRGGSHVRIFSEDAPGDSTESPRKNLSRAKADTNGPAAMILYTSGTTGAAKGAAISHHALLTHTMVLAERALLLNEQDRVLGVLPLTHSYGCRMVMLASLFVGAQIVLFPRFDAARTLRVLREQSITWLPAVPTMYAAWAAQDPIAPLPALRWCLSAGAPLAESIARRAEERLGVEVREGYGMTEATFCTINAPPDERVFGSVGKVVPGIELRIVDEAGSQVPDGVAGEVIVRGHNMMSHYLHDPDATVEATQGGFFHTGDVGRIDSAGRLAIVDRIKDLIIRGGYNIYPAEVESALAAHPAIHDVAVVGRPDAYYGEEIVAVIVLRPGATLSPAALFSFAGARLGRTKAPREIAFVDELPLGPSGKVQKRILRTWLRDGLATVPCEGPESR